MAQELLRVRCSGGYLVITETQIIYEGKSSLIGSRSLARSALTGMDSAFYFFGRKKLTFRGQGSERIQVLDVKNEDAETVLKLLR